MFNNHKIVFKALTGSHNYNLNDENSDKDWKYFVLPTFDDLYFGTMYSASKVGIEEDYTVHDVRKLVQLFWKANINFLEVLFSKEIEHPYINLPIREEEPPVIIYNYPEIQRIFNMRDEIATMNLPYLYSACKGMYFEKMKRLEKGTGGTQYLVEKFGYDTKQALHAYRVLDFCIRLSQGEPFHDALVYPNDSNTFLLDVKHGKYTLDKFADINADHYGEFLDCKPWFEQQKPNEETKAKLESLIKELVRRNLNA